MKSTKRRKNHFRQAIRPDGFPNRGPNPKTRKRRTAESSTRAYGFTIIVAKLILQNHAEAAAISTSRVPVSLRLSPVERAMKRMLSCLDAGTGHLLAGNGACRAAGTFA